jgi:hypothetical protein
MWIIGHTALGYLVTKAGFSLGKRPVRPELVLMIFFFSNIIDATHFGWLRDITHNILGTALFTALAIIVADRLGLLQKGEGPVLAGVSALHAAGDVLIGGYLPFYPFSKTVYYAFPWCSVEDLVFETVLGLLFVAVFFGSSDFGKTRAFASGQKRLFFRDFRLAKAVGRRFLHIYIFNLFYLLLVGQFVYYLLWKDLGYLFAGRWYFWIFLVAFVLMLSAISAAAFWENPKLTCPGSGSTANG